MHFTPATRLFAATALYSLMFFTVPGAEAQPPSPTRGRLPDGRAYRIDQASGLRLSDYVAELEVTTDDLRRQIVALEDELNERRQQIEQYEKQTGVKVTPKIKESTIVAKPALPPAKSAPISCSPDDPQMAALVARVRELEGQLKAGGAPAGGASPVQQARCDYDTPANPHYNELIALKKSCAAQPAAADLEQCRSDLASLQTQLAAAGRDVTERDEEIARLKQRPVETRVAARDDDASDGARARQSQETVSQGASERAKLVASLNRLQAKVNERKNLLDAVKKTGKGVSVIQPLVTRRRVTLDDIRVNVQRFQAGRDVSGIRESIAEIEKILDDDIAVLQRLSSGRG